MSGCPREGKWLGCKFEPRYDEVPRNATVEINGADAGAIRKLLFYQQYVRDVCVRCGKTIERANP